MSCAHVAATRLGHGQLIATAPTMELLGPRAGARGAAVRLPVPYGQRFSIGDTRLELIRSGHGLGAASLWVDTGRVQILYAGAVDPDRAGLGGAADVRRCDVLVLSAAYGHPRFAFPARAEVADAVAGFARRVTDAGGCAVLLVSSPSKGLDVATALATQGGFALWAHRSIYDAYRVARRFVGDSDSQLEIGTAAQAPGSAGHALSGLRLRRWSGTVPGAGVVLWPWAKRAGLGSLAAPHATALVSGLAQDDRALTQAGFDGAGFAWSNQADYAALMAYVEACGAERVFVIGRHRDTLAAALARTGQAAAALGRAEQMAFDLPRP